jgi:hypothetical protein
MMQTPLRRCSDPSVLRSSIHVPSSGSSSLSARCDFLITAETADIAVVYHAGHSIEVGGTNYLIPVDAKLARDYDVEDEAIALDRIIWALQPVKRLRLVLLVDRV